MPLPHPCVHPADQPGDPPGQRLAGDPVHTEGEDRPVMGGGLLGHPRVDGAVGDEADRDPATGDPGQQ